MAGKPKKGDDLLVPAERRRQVLKLKRQGKHYEEIATEVGYTPAYCRKLVGEALKELAAQCMDTAVEIRQLEEERLDTMYAAIQSKIAEGIVSAVETGLKIMARRSALRGLDQPTQIQVAWQSHSDSELIQEARARGVPIPFELLEAAKSMNQPLPECIASPEGRAITND